MAIIDFIQNYIPFLVEHKYIFLFVASSIEGFNTLILAGFLVSIGGLSLVPAALACLGGEIVSGFLWYTVGYFGGAKPLDWLTRRNPKRKKFVERARWYLEQHTGKLILFAKFTLSLTIATLIMTGSMRYSLKKFTFYNIIGSLGWIIITFGLGTFFGEGYKLYAEHLRQVGYLIAFILLAIGTIVLIEKSSGSIVGKTLDLEDRLHRLNTQVKKGISKALEEPDDHS